MGSPLAGSSAMAFVNTADLSRARNFYEHTLGLTIVSADDYALVASVGGVRVRIALAPNVTPAPYTVLGFEVADTHAVARALAADGIAFQRYDWLGAAQDEDGVWAAPGGTRVAWFKDPDGNVLSVSDAP